LYEHPPSHQFLLERNRVPDCGSTHDDHIRSGSSETDSHAGSNPETDSHAGSHHNTISPACSLGNSKAHASPEPADSLQPVGVHNPPSNHGKAHLVSGWAFHFLQEKTYSRNQRDFS